MNVFLERARLLMQQSRFELAEEQLRLSLAEQEDPGLAHALLSLCLLQRDRYDQAQQEAQTAIGEDPENAMGFYALATVYHERNRLDEARTAIMEAIRLESWHSMHFGRLASIEVDSHRWNEALKAAELGLQFDPDDVHCTNLRAVALVRLGRKDEAGATIDAALAKQPEDAQSHANQGWTLLHKGQPKQAMEHFREALRLEPNMEWARLGIIEAMKARNILYRWILGYFLWMTKFSPRVQLMLILGILFGAQILQAVCQAVPMLAPVQVPLAITYALFVWTTWVAPTLFNLLLLLSKFGRLALNRSEKLDAALAALCIATTLGIGIYGHVRYPIWVSEFWQCGLLFLGLMFPVTAIFKMPAKTRWVLIVYSIGLTAYMVIAVYHLQVYAQEYALLPDPNKIGQLDHARLQNLLNRHEKWWMDCLMGIVISTWVTAAVSMIPNRK
jgi:tetratricopeptide (TPR) repeat protein